MTKSIVFFGNTQSTSTVTLSEAASVAWFGNKSEYSHMDILLNVKTLVGTSATFSIQEKFSGVGFVETGKSTAITAVGNYMLANEGQTGQTTEANITYGHGMMGKGQDKQVVMTASSLTSLNVDIYFIFYK